MDARAQHLQRRAAPRASERAVAARPAEPTEPHPATAPLYAAAPTERQLTVRAPQALVRAPDEEAAVAGVQSASARQAPPVPLVLARPVPTALASPASSVAVARPVVASTASASEVSVSQLAQLDSDQRSVVPRCRAAAAACPAASGSAAPRAVPWFSAPWASPVAAPTAWRCAAWAPFPASCAALERSA